MASIAARRWATPVTGRCRIHPSSQRQTRGAATQAISHLMFAWLSTQGASVPALVIAISAYNFSQSFAGTILVTYMSGLTGAGFAATQYALLSSLYALPAGDVASLAPEIALATAGTLLLLLEAFAPALRRAFVPLAVVATVAAGWLLAGQASGASFHGLVEATPLTRAFSHAILVATALALSIPWTVKSAVDTLEREGMAAQIGPYVLLILGLAAAHGVARLVSRFAILGAAQWVEHDVRQDLYARLLTLPPAFYHRHRTGDLMSRAANDISTLRALSGFGCVMLVGTVFVFLGTLWAMWSIDPWLTLFAMAPFPERPRRNDRTFS